MKALVYTGIKQVELREVDKPVAKDDEHLIRIMASGICGSDMHAYLGHDNRRPAPLVLGHEAAGIIEGGAWDGKRVTINPLVTCGTCQACMTGRENLCPERQIISMPPRAGAFAEYVCQPESNLVEVPDHVPLEKAAMAEPLAVSWHAVRLGLEALFDGMDRRAAVLGGGAIGLAAALAFKAQGLTDVTVVEPNDSRRGFLNDQCDVIAIPALNGSYPIILDAAGFEKTRETASAQCQPGGVIVHVGLGQDLGGLDVRRMTLQEITFIGTYTYSAQDFRDTCSAIFDGRLGPLDWTLIRPLSDGARAMDQLLAGDVPNPKILLDPTST